jgi:hypothetical protein
MTTTDTTDRFRYGLAEFYFTLYQIAAERGDTELAGEQLAQTEQVMEGR